MPNSKRTKPPLTLAEHEVIGADLTAIRAKLEALVADLSARYPDRVAAHAGRARGAIDTLRNALDTVLWGEQRGSADRATLDRVYYPPESKAEPAAPATSFADKP